MNLFSVSIVNVFVVALAVMIHYEVLYRISLAIPQLNIHHRFRIVIGVLAALFAHALEIWAFAVAFYFMHKTEGWGNLVGNFNGSILDCVYFSFSVYTTLGFGDITPLGNLRYLTGIESLTGLLLITWSASFLYIELQRSWDLR
jgi:hypothetical protein